jgi:radical SAM protein with 4Fe4S-binding SPASM domain
MPAAFDEGNIRDRPLEDIWLDPAAFAYRRRFDPTRLVGTCRDCAYERICGGGCTALAYAALGRTGENPYCLHRLARNRCR